MNNNKNAGGTVFAFQNQSHLNGLDSKENGLFNNVVGGGTINIEGMPSNSPIVTSIKQEVNPTGTLDFLTTNGDGDTRTVLHNTVCPQTLSGIIGHSSTVMNTITSTGSVSSNIDTVDPICHTSPNIHKVTNNPTSQMPGRKAYLLMSSSNKQHNQTSRSRCKPLLPKIVSTNTTSSVSTLSNTNSNNQQLSSVNNTSQHWTESNDQSVNISHNNSNTNNSSTDDTFSVLRKQLQKIIPSSNAQFVPNDPSSTSLGFKGGIDLETELLNTDKKVSFNAGNEFEPLNCLLTQNNSTCIGVVNTSTGCNTQVQAPPVSPSSIRSNLFVPINSNSFGGQVGGNVSQSSSANASPFMSPRGTPFNRSRHNSGQTNSTYVTPRSTPFTPDSISSSGVPTTISESNTPFMSPMSTPMMSRYLNFDCIVIQF